VPPRLSLSVGCCWSTLVLGLALAGCGRSAAQTQPERPPPARPADAAAAAVAAAPAAADLPSINCRPDLAAALVNPSASPVRCVVDVGSRNVKLVVAAARDREPGSFESLRQCRARLQLGDKAVDPATGNGQALPHAEQQALVALIEAYARRCSADGGKLAEALATEWARRASNTGAVAALVAARTGTTLSVLSREDEARFGYLSATRGARGKLVLDFGSRSLQLAFWPRQADAPEVVSVPLGIDEAGDRYFGARDSGFKDGKVALMDSLRKALGPTLERARLALRKKQLDPELYSLGENGDMALAASGKLWAGTPPSTVDEAGYGTAVKASLPTASNKYGRVSAVLTPRDMQRVAQTITRTRPLFESLRSPRLRRVFGNKMLVYPVLIELFARELGVRTLVLVPQEMADGYLIAKLK
jgi:hypothetical protein